ncbi:sensor histidine kinase [Kitasatospora sp. NPDC057500]|uniref:sensor histidine kinase n=1 Tax=Kitasatospora sp. NPDC057500 TaxID=3346151 RepID=UPI00368301E3
MLGAGSSSGRRRSAPVLVWLLPTLATAAVAAVTVAAASPGARTGVALCAAVGTMAVVLVAAEAARRGRVAEELRTRAVQREGELLRRLTRQETEYIRLAKSVLPAAMTRLTMGEGLENVVRAYALQDVTVGAEFRAAHQTLLRAVLETVENEEALRESARRSFVNIARRVQAIVHRQAAELRSMEHAHGNDPAVFGDLLLLDHGNALIGRLADSIAVLGGARPGRQWNKAVPLYSVLRGAMSRILDFERVELHPVSEVAVVGPAVEPLIHAVAELLDNATRYSPPHTLVHLTAVEVQTGIAIEIEDGGLSLSEEGRARAERMIAEAQAGADLNDLGETPRLGLAVVGRLCQAYGLQVSLRPSAYGGVRAVLVFPQELITTAPATGRAHGIGVTGSSGPDPVDDRRPHTSPPPRRPLTGPPPGPLSGTRSPAFKGASLGGSRRDSFGGSFGGPRGGSFNGPATGGDDVPVVTERTATGLPRRRRHAAPANRFVAGATGRPTTAGPGTPAHGTPTGGRPPAPPGRPADTEQDAVQPGLWLAAFTEGINGTGPDGDGSSSNSNSGNGDSTGTRRDER